MNTEIELLLAARKMDKKVLAEIFELYARPLYKFTLRFCNDSLLADQIVGDVFAKFLDQLARGKGPLNNLRSYLFEIAFHLVIDEVRYVSRRASIELVDVRRYDRFFINPDIEEQLELEKISQAMKSLSADQRHVIVLRFMEGFSIYETARILRKTAGSVKITQFRAIWNLRVALGIDPSVSPVSSDLETVLESALNPPP